MKFCFGNKIKETFGLIFCYLAKQSNVFYNHAHPRNGAVVADIFDCASGNDQRVSKISFSAFAHIIYVHV